MKVGLRDYIAYVDFVTATGMRFSALITRSVQKLAGTLSCRNIQIQ